jgi:hypothetical protein
MSEDHQYFYRQDIYDILTGAALLASGGGGSIDTAKDLAETILDYSDRVEYVDPMQTKDHDMAIVVAAMGSPQELKKKGVKEGPRRAFEQMEKETGQQICYTVPMETGAVNQLVPMLVSVQKGIPILNGDGGGRSFPKLSMATFSKIKEILNWPFVISTEASFEEGGTKAVVYQRDIGAHEKLLRSIISGNLGGIASLACYLMECRYLRSQAIVRDTLTRARDVGRTIRESLEQGKDPSDMVISNLNGYKLARGTIDKISPESKGGFDWITVSIVCEGDGRKVEVKGENENLLAFSDDGQIPLAMGPDLICYMGENGPLTNADIKVGLKITLIGLKADPPVRAASIVAMYMDVASKLGYKGPYIPIEDLAGKPTSGGRV